MDRPNVILYVSASIDGRISLGPNRTMIDIDERDEVLGTEEEWQEFSSKIEQDYEPEVWMEGSNMLVKEGQELRELESFEGDDEYLYQDYLPDEIVNRSGREGWLAVVDGRGRLRSGYKGEENKPMLHLVSHGVPEEYLAFLQDKKIPYLISGEDRVDLARALEKMRSKLGVENIITGSGGKLSGALLRKGLLDEVNIRFNPVIIGGFETPYLFSSPDLEDDEWPTELELISGEVEEDGHIFVRYKVKKE
ncbi:MAG: dihydrofolate reductase family protein [Candidatus Saliniplasma sp.]